MRRIAGVPLLLAALTGGAGCGGDAGREPLADRAGASAPPASPGPPALAPVLADPALATIPMESTGVALGDWDMAYAATDREDFWLVDYSWLYLDRAPVELHSVPEMFDLEAAGLIDSSTVVSFAVYRTGLEASGIPELRERARAHRPPQPPPVLIEAVEAFLREHPPAGSP